MGCAVSQVSPADDEMTCGVAPADPHFRPVKRRRATTPLPPVVPFPADRLFLTVVEALARPAAWRVKDELASYIRGFQGLQIKLIVEKSEHNQLERLGAGLLKLNTVLCARTWLDKTNRHLAHVTVTQLCEDMGYVRHKHGGFHRENRQMVLTLLRVVSRIRVRVTLVSKRGQEPETFGDRVWSIKYDVESDVVTVETGNWDSRLWREKNGYVGLVTRDLGRMNPRQHGTAIRLGTYYTALSRVNRYQERPFEVSQLLERTGLSRLDAKHPSRQRDRFIKAHQTLVEAGVIKAWRFEGPADWVRSKVVVSWPDDLEARGMALLAKQEKVILSRVAAKARGVARQSIRTLQPT